MPSTPTSPHPTTTLYRSRTRSSNKYEIRENEEDTKHLEADETNLPSSSTSHPPLSVNGKTGSAPRPGLHHSSSSPFPSHHPRNILTPLSQPPFFSFYWVTPSIVIDWLCTVLLIIGCIVVEKTVPVYKRDVDIYLDDPNLRQKFNGGIKFETVPSHFSTLLCFWIPMILTVLIGIFRRSLHEANHAALACVAGHFFSRFPLDLLKHAVGRFRPDFLDRCQWDPILKECTGAEKWIEEGRKSFPSGHSQTSWGGMIFLVLFFAGKTKAFVLSEPLPPKMRRHSTHLLTFSRPRRPHLSSTPSQSFSSVVPSPLGFDPLSSRLLLLLITICPFLLSGYIALSRIHDHVHHPTDIIFGSILGLIGGTVCYLIWWPAPWIAPWEVGTGEEWERDREERIERMARPRDWHAVARRWLENEVENGNAGRSAKVSLGILNSVGKGKGRKKRRASDLLAENVEDEHFDGVRNDDVGIQNGRRGGDTRNGKGNDEENEALLAEIGAEANVENAV